MRRRQINFAKYNAQHISHNVKTKYMSGNLLPRPLWMSAVDAFPPVPTPTHIRSYDLTNFDSMLPLKSKVPEGRMEQLEGYCNGMGTFKWFKMYRKNALKHNNAARRKAVMEADSIYSFPRDIVYPEDALRERFYGDHPLEQFSVRSLQENTKNARDAKSMNQVLNEMFPGTAASTPKSTDANKNADLLDGEAVVRYQLELMEKQKIPEEEAYQTACKKFYADQAKLQQIEDDSKAVLEASAKKARDLLEAQNAAVVDEAIFAIDEDTKLEVTETTEIEKLFSIEATDAKVVALSESASEAAPKALTAAEEWLKMEDEAFEKGCAIRYQNEVTRQLSAISRKQSTAI